MCPRSSDPYYAVCPRSSDQFYIVRYKYKIGHYFLDTQYSKIPILYSKRKNGSLLPGHIVYWVDCWIILKYWLISMPRRTRSKYKKNRRLRIKEVFLVLRWEKWHNCKLLFCKRKTKKSFFVLSFRFQIRSILERFGSDSSENKNIFFAKYSNKFMCVCDGLTWSRSDLSEELAQSRIRKITLMFKWH